MAQSLLCGFEIWTKGATHNEKAEGHCVVDKNRGKGDFVHFQCAL